MFANIIIKKLGVALFVEVVVQNFTIDAFLSLSKSNPAAALGSPRPR